MTAHGGQGDARQPWMAPYEGPCNCDRYCGDDGDSEGPGVCKDLPRAPEPPLVEFFVVHRDDDWRRQ